MLDAATIRTQLLCAVSGAGLAVDPIVIETSWDVGPVTAYLYPGDPVTLIDCGMDGEASRAAVGAAFERNGLRLHELRRIIVTHAHSDHMGGAAFLQEQSGCEVLLHADDAASMTRGPGAWEARRTMMGSLGLTDQVRERLFGRHPHPAPTRRRPQPEVVVMHDDQRFRTGNTRLRVEHRPGHTPGHVWIVDEAGDAVFVGDYLLAHSPTNAGLEPDEQVEGGRRAMLGLYHAGLEELASRDFAVVLPGHGHPILDHRTVAAKRLAKSRERTERVLRVLARTGESTAFEVAFAMFGTKMQRDVFDYLADVVGRLDLLVADGRVESSWRGGVWYFSPRGEMDETPMTSDHRWVMRGGRDA